jgi:hypothetical protein
MTLLHDVHNIIRHGLHTLRCVNHMPGNSTLVRILELGKPLPHPQLQITLLVSFSSVSAKRRE